MSYAVCCDTPKFQPSIFTKLDNKFTTTKKIRDFFFSQAICNYLQISYISRAEKLFFLPPDYQAVTSVKQYVL